MEPEHFKLINEREIPEELVSVDRAPVSSFIAKGFPDDVKISVRPQVVWFSALNQQYTEDVERAMHGGSCFFSEDGKFVLYQDTRNSRIVEAKFLKNVSTYRDCHQYVAECDRKEFWLPEASWSYWEYREKRLQPVEACIEPAEAVRELGMVAINLAGHCRVVQYSFRAPVSIRQNAVRIHQNPSRIELFTYQIFNQNSEI